MESENKIIHYDFNGLDYSSYYLTGFFQNSGSYQYDFKISKSAPSLLQDRVTHDGWEDIMFSICVFKAIMPDEEFYFCIDTRDSCEVETNKGKGYHIPLLKQVKYYYKVNYNQSAIDRDSDLRTYADKIIPVLPFFAVKPPRLLAHLPRIFPCKSMAWSPSDTIRRLRLLRTLVPLERLIQMRTAGKDLDIFFVLRFYD